MKNELTEETHLLSKKLEDSIHDQLRRKSSTVHMVKGMIRDLEENKHSDSDFKKISMEYMKTILERTEEI